MSKEPEVTVINEDGTIRAIHCKIQQVLSKEVNGPITHVAMHWYDDTWDEDTWDEDTGHLHVVAVEDILYERGEPIYARNNHKFEPEIIISRMVISEKLRNDVYDRDGRKCLKCGAEENLCIDHIMPFCRGGKTEFDNLQTLCQPCNQRKKAAIW
jgi:hypothetical protein